MYQLILTGQSLIQHVSTLADAIVLLNTAVAGTVEKVLKNGSPMSVVRNGYGKVGIQQPGPVVDVFLSMLDEVDLAYIRPSPWDSARQPYEILPKQWEAFVAVGSACYGVYPCFTEEQRRTRCEYTNYAGELTSGTIDYFMSSVMQKRFGYAHNGPLYGRQKDSNSRHEVHVAYALAEGKTVPNEVIEWYHSNPKKVESIGLWFSLLLNWAEYRGKMSAQKLSYLANLLKLEKIELTNENSAFFINLMAELPEDCTMTDADDFLYGKGVLKLRETKLSAVPPDLSQAYSHFALVLRERLGQWRKQDAIEQANEQRVKYHHTLRQLHERLKEAEHIPAVEDLRYPSKFAEAIDRRDIKVLLTYLDTPNDANVVTKKAVQEVFGFKVLGLKAAERRNAIFTFCGYDSVKRAEYEKELVEHQAAVAHSRAIESAKKAADSANVRVDGKIISGSEYVDLAFTEGFTDISTSKKGATTQYWLSNPVTGSSRSIWKKNGTLDYAKTVCGATDIRQAA